MSSSSSNYSSFFEVEITISSAKDLKNVNWRHGDLKPYVVLWVDPNNYGKCSTKVAKYGDEDDNHLTWDETLIIPLTAPIDESTTLYIHIVHANAEEDVKPLIGFVRLSLRDDIVDDVGIGKRGKQKLQLKRPSGRPQGKLEFEIMVREARYHASDPYHTPSYGVAGVPPPLASGDYPTPDPYHHASPYGAPPTNESNYGVGTGLAVGAVAGVLGGLALAEGFGHLEDDIVEDVEERVEEDSGVDDDGGYGDDGGGYGNDGGGGE